MTELKDKMCACKTPACATAVTDEQTKWAQGMTKVSEAPKLSDEDTKKFSAVGQDFAKCLAEATKVAAPTTPEPLPSPADTGSGSAGSVGSAGSAK